MVVGVELVVWLVLAACGKADEKPQRRKFKRPGWAQKKAPGWLQLGLLGAILLSIGGYAAHEHFFKAEVAFVSRSGTSPLNIQYELVSESGKRTAGLGELSYATYRWDTIRVADARYEPQEIVLTKEDQVIELVPTLKQELKEQAVRTAVEVAVRPALEHFFGKKKEGAGE